MRTLGSMVVLMLQSRKEGELEKREDRNRCESVELQKPMVWKTKAEERKGDHHDPRYGIKNTI